MSRVHRYLIKVWTPSSRSRVRSRVWVMVHTPHAIIKDRPNHTLRPFHLVMVSLLTLLTTLILIIIALTFMQISTPARASDQLSVRLHTKRLVRCFGPPTQRSMPISAVRMLRGGGESYHTQAVPCRPGRRALLRPCAIINGTLL